jgi:hypothetical protein
MMMTYIIMGLLVAAMLLSVLITEVYAQSNQITDLALFDEIDEDHEPLVSEILNQLLNHTADKIVIDEAGRMIIS